jgi:hypothetical protein
MPKPPKLLISRDTQTPSTFTPLKCKLNEFQSAVQMPKVCSALPTIDPDIDAVKGPTFSMVTHRNILAPISNLPTEILVCIFHMIAFSVHYWLGLVHVTHVCRRWRQIALDHTSLWTYFSGREPKIWIAEQLSRARNAPLVIEHFRWSMAGREEFSLFTPHIFHTRELHLHRLSPNIVQEIRTLKAPLLERLELHLWDSPMRTFSKC